MSERKIHFPDGEVWTYRVGRGHVKIRRPDRKAFAPQLWEVTGTTPDVIERGQWKKTSDGWVTPSMVKKYIEEKLRERASDQVC